MSKAPKVRTNVHIKRNVYHGLLLFMCMFYSLQTAGAGCVLVFGLVQTGSCSLQAYSTLQTPLTALSCLSHCITSFCVNKRRMMVSVLSSLSGGLSCQEEQGAS